MLTADKKTQQTDLPREIPFNYTSADDHQIVIFLLGQPAWDLLGKLRDQRKTGRSARLLMRVLGDLFVLRRNPYLQQELIDSTKRRQRYANKINHDLNEIDSNAAGNADVLDLVRQSRYLAAKLLRDVNEAKVTRKRLRKVLGAVIGKDNVMFDPFALVSHATDATDWRLYLPLCVVFPIKTEQVAPLLKAIEAEGLKVIPRGAGTGLTGGAVPLEPNCVMVNTEMLNRIKGYGEDAGPEGAVHWMEVEAGVVTEDAMKAASARGRVFATDPTSSWACTVGGNIAENAGGKTAVLWGTCIDNLLSWKMALPGDREVEITRLQHPMRKIQPDDVLRYQVSEGNETRVIEMPGDQARRKGLWKDVTNKALGGVPGLQKEGTDGIITSARFVIHQAYEKKQTACIEFFGADMKEASQVILDLSRQFKNTGSETLQALEHFDEEYVEVIEYKTKNQRDARPKAVLLIDLVAHDNAQLAKGKERLQNVLKSYPDSEIVFAADSDEAALYWKDRKQLGAIAKRTNAFKLNEDVVLPLNQLADFSEFIDTLNAKVEVEDLQLQVTGLRHLLGDMSATNPGLRSRATGGSSIFDKAHRSAEKCEREARREGKPVKVMLEKINEHFAGHKDFLESAREYLEETRSRRIVIATHMHAGDGNVHVNIPVFSNDREMMRRAMDTADTVMQKAVAMGGVVSGEHGIGVTKIAHLDQTKINELNKHRQVLDPKGLMNPGKLQDQDILSKVYTPSFNLLKLEAHILQHDQLAKLASMIQTCIRCGKCKPDCCVFDPKRGMFYHPRNKNLAITSIIEALLFDAQRSQSTEFEVLRHLENVADHCTLCHKCSAPCPVDIDTAEVSLLERQILKARGIKKIPLVTQASLNFLKKSRNRRYQAIFRFVALGVGVRAQRWGAWLTSKLPLGRWRRVGPLNQLRSMVPLAGAPTLPSALPTQNGRQALLYEPENPSGKTVFYFPGCGSERLRGDIGRATLYILQKAGVRVILPPQGLCCGFPFGVNAQEEERKGIETRNTIIFNQIHDMFSNLTFDAVVVSCGTCMEALEGMAAAQIFGCTVKDAAEVAIDAGLKHEAIGDNLYHRPCHDSLKGEAKAVLEKAGGTMKDLPACCGEAGTMALSRPDISADMVDRKTDEVKEALQEKPERTTVLTNCPACVQGLGRQEQHGVVVKHLSVKLSEAAGGENWQEEAKGLSKTGERVTF